MRRGAARAWIVAVVLALPGVAHGETFAVVPMVGRQLTVVTADRKTGSNLDHNQYQYLPIGDEVFADAVDAAVSKVVRSRRAEDRTMVVRLGLDASPEELASPELVTKVIAAVAPKAVEAGVTRLVVVAPYRAAPMLDVDDGHLGTGNAAGIGLYVNRFQPMSYVGAAASDYGFLGVFANVRVLVVDARSSAVVAEDVARTGSVFPAVDAPDHEPVNALTPARKIESLKAMLTQAIDNVLPGVMDRASQQKP
jgi:hypothetical protein